jgi:hypothetical protein
MATMYGWRYRREWDAEDRRLMGPVLWAFVGLNLVLSLVLPFVDGVGHGVGFLVGVCLGLFAPRAGRWFERTIGVLWMTVYAGAFLFGVWWVWGGWTALKWSHYWMNGG